MHHIQHGKTFAVTQVKAAAGAAFFKVAQCQQVGFRQVGNVYIIPQAGAVGRRVIAAEYFYVLAQAGRGIQRQGYQVRLREMQFARLGGGGRPGGVKVAQGRVFKAVGRAVVGQYLFYHLLGAAVRVYRGKRQGFRHRQPGRHAINGAGRRENKFIHSGCAHGVQQVYGVGYVIAVILGGVGN